jgi:endonuclease-3
MGRMNERIPVAARARRIVRKLAELYPDSRPALEFGNPLHLLIATILSAQCTDARVNQVTPALFARFPDAAALAGADRKELHRLIKSTGFYRNKARNIMLCCRQLLERHGGEVPARMEDLVRLAGVGRKTANVVLGNAFGTPGIPVDTHVARLSQRMGLTGHSNPVKIERDLMALIPAKEWTAFALRMMSHGRKVCKSRRPRCAMCSLASLCPRVGVEEQQGKASPLPEEPGAGRRKASDIAVSNDRIRRTP